jgi:hypothetical protein
MKHVLMFQPRFAALVKAGTKLQTIRPVPKRMPKAGDPISLRMWLGKPYRSKQVVLHESTIIKVEEVFITQGPAWPNFWFDGVRLTAPSALDFSQADGFTSPNELGKWFDSNYGLPFTGIVIEWEPPQISQDGLKSAVNAVDQILRGVTRCERDTDGDGNCGRPLCPNCGTSFQIPAKIPADRSHTRPQTTANELPSSQSRPTNHPENIGVSAEIVGFRPKRRRGGMADTGDLKPL